MFASVIVPVYNVETYLPRCLDSIMDQDFEDYEVIIVDDGSTDGSGKLADQYAEKYPKRIQVIHQKNQGLGGARNTGIEAAQGDYYLFVDSDDTIEPNTLSELWHKVSQTGAQIICFGMKSVNENGKVIAEVIDAQAHPQLFTLEEDKSILCDSPSACNKLFHRDLFRKTGIRFPLRVWYEDVWVTPKLLMIAEKIAVTDRSYYHYFQHTGSIMHNSDIERNLEIIDALDHILVYYKNQGVFEQYKRELEFLAIKHIFIAASVRILRVDPKSRLLQKIKEYMDNTFPTYYTNPYIKTLDRNKKLVYLLLSRKMYNILRLVFKLKV